MAYQRVLIYKITILNPKEDLFQLINKLQSLIIIQERNTPVKEYIYIYFFLWIAATIIKIKAETKTKITKTLAVIKHTDNLILIADLRDITISAKKRFTIYKDI